jgi:hypothetical protein
MRVLFATILATFVVAVPTAQADFGFQPGPAGLEVFAGGPAPAPDTCRAAIDGHGYTYTSSYYAHEITISKGGEKVTHITNEDPLDGPCDMSVDATGHIYVNNYHRNVVRFTPSSYPPTNATTYGGETVVDSKHSSGVALDNSTGQLFVDDRTYVAVYEPTQLSEVEPTPVQKIGLGTLVDGRRITLQGSPSTGGRIKVIDAGDQTEKVYMPSSDPTTPLETIAVATPPQEPDQQAGSHPYVLRAGFNFNLKGEIPGHPGLPATDGDLRDLVVEEPAGLIENPQAVPRCPLTAFSRSRNSPFEESRSGESCPDSSQVGVVELRSSASGGAVRDFGLYNLEPPPGAPSGLGFAPFGVPIVFVPHIRQSGGEYGVTLVAKRVPQTFSIYGLRLDLWGTPWDEGHDGQRGGCLNEAEPQFPWAKCKVTSTVPPEAYLTLPANCSAPFTFTASADSWQDPGTFLPDGEPDLSEAAWKSSQSVGEALQRCDKLHFIPTARTVPSTDRVSTATGLDFDLEPDTAGLLEPKGLAGSAISRTVVTLPRGMTINPSLAAGLGVCTPAGYAGETLDSAPGAGCPNDSKIGDFTVTSPLFGKSIEGSLFLADPHNNPFGSLLALYLVAKEPERGILVKVAGPVHLDSESGQLVADFGGLPQLPYSQLKISFREGQRAPLVNPAACGSYTSQIDLSPWLDADTVLRRTSTFQLDKGIGGVACPGAGPAPFAPGARAGTLNSNAGSYTPFYLHLTRTDGEQEITSYSAELPPGLLAKIAGTPACSDADIAAAATKTGAEEEQNPSCPAASQIGHTYSGYGLGPVLAYAPGGLYLAGPYKGSPLSIVAIDSATVGPFDLGVIVVRSAIRVNPHSAQVSIDSTDSDPIPHIIDGIPLHLRDIRVYISRPGFTLNPTSCDASQVVSTLTGSSAPFSNPADILGTAAVPFQPFNCSALRFTPKLSLRLRGGTKRGDYPSLRVVVTPHPGDTNIAKAAVTLPLSEFLAQEHIKTVCTKVQLEQEACPAGSVYGHASAVTPLLSEPLEGPVYLSTGYGHELPDLVAQLHGHGITIDLNGRIDAPHGGLRGSFEGLPDAPVSKFTMVLYGGKRGLLANEKNLCTSNPFGSARFVGQDNSGEALAPRLLATCPGKKKSPHKHKGARHRRGAKPREQARR